MEGLRVGFALSPRDGLPSSSRYELLLRIAAGGMATVYVGRLVGASGFRRHVAIKRAHAHLLEDASFRRMLAAEARLSARLHHPHVVAVQDVEELEGELLLVMDYVEGASLAALLGVEGEEPLLPTSVAIRVLLDVCAGLDAAHRLTGEDGARLGLVHRDVSPQNILVGLDGIARLGDFGIAKTHEASGPGTATGALKGKLGYMAPEYVERGEIDSRADIWALGVVAWEAVTRKRLFRGTNDVESLKLVLHGSVPPPSKVASWLGPSLDGVLLRALAREPNARFASAAEFGVALEEAARREGLVGAHSEVAAHVEKVAGRVLEERRTLLRGGPKRGGSDPDVTSMLGRETATASMPGLPGVTPPGGTLGSGVSRPGVAGEKGARAWSKPALVLAGLVVATAAVSIFVGAQTTRGDSASESSRRVEGQRMAPEFVARGVPSARALSSANAPSPSAAPETTATVTSTEPSPPAVEAAAKSRPAPPPASSAPPVAPRARSAKPTSDQPKAFGPARRSLPTAKEGSGEPSNQGPERAPPNPYAR